MRPCDFAAVLGLPFRGRPRGGSGISAVLYGAGEAKWPRGLLAEVRRLGMQAVLRTHFRSPEAVGRADVVASGQRHHPSVGADVAPRPAPPQMLMEILIPAKIVEGVTLKNGRKLPYPMNGLAAFFLSHIIPCPLAWPQGGRLPAFACDPSSGRPIHAKFRLSPPCGIGPRFLRARKRAGPQDLPNQYMYRLRTSSDGTSGPCVLHGPRVRQVDQGLCRTSKLFFPPESCCGALFRASQICFFVA